MGNANLRTPPTPANMKGFHWARSLAAIPSIFGSILMIQHILRSRKRRSRTISRVLLGMSSNDLIFAICAVFGTLFNPKGVYPDWMNPYASGTWKTCEASGFLLQLSSTSSVIYNGVLTLCYLLLLRFEWNDRQLKRIEPFLHILPPLIGIAMSSVSLAKELYSPTGVACSIQEYPPGCLESGNCIRGNHAHAYTLGLFFSWVWMVFVFICTSMYLIYQSIARREDRSRIYDFRRSIRKFRGNDTVTQKAEGESTNAEASNSRKQSLRFRFAMQSLFYCIVYFLTWIWGTINVTVHKSKAVPHSYIPILYLLSIFEPLQGFLNMAVYFRPRYLAYRRKMEDYRLRSSHLKSSGEKTSSSKTFRSPISAIRYAFAVTDQGNEDPDDVPSEDEMGQIGTREKNSGEQAKMTELLGEEKQKDIEDEESGI